MQAICINSTEAMFYYDKHKREVHRWSKMMLECCEQFIVCILNSKNYAGNHMALDKLYSNMTRYTKENLDK